MFALQLYKLKMSIKPHRFCHLFKPFLVFLKSIRKLPFTVFIKLPLCFISFLLTCLTTWTSVIVWGFFVEYGVSVHSVREGGAFKTACMQSTATGAGSGHTVSVVQVCQLEL